MIFVIEFTLLFCIANTCYSSCYVRSVCGEFCFGSCYRNCSDRDCLEMFSSREIYFRFAAANVKSVNLENLQSI